MTVPYETAKNDLLQAALMHVAFDGWTEATFNAAIRDADIAPSVARAVYPRGAIDMAIAFHKAGDQQMLTRLKEADLSDLKFREKITAAVRIRLQIVEDKEAVRRGTTLFALPFYAPDGAKLIWGTCDHIWNTLGDTSDDVNWYTKRTTLAGVYSATVLYWLGDDSPDHEATWAFLERRIADVMRIEEFKAKARKSPTFGRLMAGPNWLMSHVRAPARMPKMDLPGSWTAPRD
ncbi:MAG: COQ9 family protein [Roseobacter sp.]